MATDAEGNILESWTVYTGNPKVGNSALSISTTSKDYANAQLINVSTSTATGNPYTDFVWKNQAMQLNDVRTPTPKATVTAVTSATYPGYLTYTTSAAHGFTQGQQINVSGIKDVVVGAVGSLGNPLNVTNTNIDSVPSTTTFCVQSTLSANLSGLTAVATQIPDSTVTYGGVGNAQWASTSTTASAVLDYSQGYHGIAEANYSGYPNFIAGSANLIVTAVSGNGTTVSYTAQSNGLVPGSLNGTNVSITGLTNSAFNLTNATIASHTAAGFTVTSAAGSGVSLTGQNGIAQLGLGAADSDGALVGGVVYVTVPSVLGLTTANAQASLLASEFTVTTAGNATNTPITVTAITRTAGSAVAVLTATGAGAAYGVGTSVTVSGLTAGNAEFNGTWTVTANATNTFTITSAGTTVINASALSGSVIGTSGTIKTQSVAAGTASVAVGAAITITPWA